MHLLYSRFFAKALADLGIVARARALQAALQPGPDPRRRRRADEQEPRQRPGPRRAGESLRRRLGAPVPDVHGPLGPGRPLEPDAASRACTASCGASGPSRSTRTGARASDSGALPDGQDLAAAERALRVGGPSDADGRDRGPRGLPLEHDGRQAHGADQPAHALPRHRGRRHGGLGRGRPAAAADARARSRRTSPRSCGRGASRRPASRGARSTPRPGRPCDPALVAADEIELPVQVNGKLRDLVPHGARAATRRGRARSSWRGPRSRRTSTGARWSRSSTSTAGWSTSSSGRESRPRRSCRRVDLEPTAERPEAASRRVMVTVICPLTG